MTLVTWGGVIGRNIPFPGVKAACTPVFESNLNGFRPKEAPFNFPLDRHFIDTVTDINRRNFQGERSFSVATTSIQTFSEVRSLDVTW